LRQAIEPTLIPCDHEWLRNELVGRATQPAVAAAHAVDLVVQSPHEIVHHGLHVELSEAGEDFAANVGFTVAVSVLEIPKVRCGGDKHAPFPARDAGGP